MIKIDGMETEKGRDKESDYRSTRPQLVWCCNTLGPVGKKCHECKKRRVS